MTGVKELVVHVGQTVGDPDFAPAYAISLAARLGAGLTGLAPRFELGLSWSELSRIPGGFLGEQQRRADETAREALAAFAARARAAGVEVRTDLLGGDAGPFFQLFAARARVADAAIVGQARPRGDSWERALVEALLFDSGRPVLVVPYVHSGPARFARVLVAWDGTAPAARAVHDALPLMAVAEDVKVLTVQTEARGPLEVVPPGEVAAHLARHGVKASGETIERRDMGVAASMLSFAADYGADLIVMGAYGHFKLRNLVFGRATSGVLDAMTVPVLMSR